MFIVVLNDFHSIVCMQEVSPATAVTYSEDGKRFTVGHRNGYMQIWEGTFMTYAYKPIPRVDDGSGIVKPCYSGLDTKKKGLFLPLAIKF